MSRAIIVLVFAAFLAVNALSTVRNAAADIHHAAAVRAAQMQGE